MVHNCAICNAEIEEDYGKLKGTIVKVVEKDKNKFIYVCSKCQSDEPEKYIEKAKIKSV